MSRQEEDLIFVDLISPGFNQPLDQHGSEPITPLTAEQVQAISDSAYAEGLKIGFEEGYAKGKALAESENHEEKEALVSLASQFRSEVATKSRQICEDVLSLALVIAKTMIKEEIKVNHKIILNLIKDATSKFIKIEELTLFVHPQDAVLVRKYMESEIALNQWNIIEDEQMEQGGCRLETSVNSIDASNETRWMKIIDALGSSNEWREI